MPFAAEGAATAIAAKAANSTVNVRLESMMARLARGGATFAPPISMTRLTLRGERRRVMSQPELLSRWLSPLLGDSGDQI